MRLTQRKRVASHGELTGVDRLLSRGHGRLPLSQSGCASLCLIRRPRRLLGRLQLGCRGCFERRLERLDLVGKVDAAGFGGFGAPLHRGTLLRVDLESGLPLGDGGVARADRRALHHELGLKLGQPAGKQQLRFVWPLGKDRVVQT